MSQQQKMRTATLRRCGPEVVLNPGIATLVADPVRSSLQSSGCPPARMMRRANARIRPTPSVHLRPPDNLYTLPSASGIRGSRMPVSEGNAAVSAAAPTDLVSRIAAGDRRAEQEFVRSYERGVRALVRRHCRPNDPIVDDLAQDVLARVLERLRAGAIREASALPAYVQATIVYTTSAEYRSRRNTESAATIEDMPALDNPVERLGSEQLAGLLRKLLAQLPVARDREILVRFYLEEQDKDEVCRGLGIDASHFHRVVFRARERFRALLDGAGIGET